MLQEKLKRKINKGQEKEGMSERRRENKVIKVRGELKGEMREGQSNGRSDIRKTVR